MNNTVYKTSSGKSIERGSQKKKLVKKLQLQPIKAKPSTKKLKSVANTISNYRYRRKNYVNRTKRENYTDSCFPETNKKIEAYTKDEYQT